MTLNFPGPQQIRLFYTTTPVGFQPMQHVAKYNVQVSAGSVVPGTPFNALSVALRNGGGLALDTYINNWVALLQPLFATAANNTIDFAELWQYPPASNDGSFVSVYAINLPGTTALPSIAAQQSIITFRTIEGGIMRLSFMETITTGLVADTPPLANAAAEAIQVFVSGLTNGWRGADTSYPFATRAFFPGQNEALFKKRYRDL